MYWGVAVVGSSDAGLAWNCDVANGKEPRVGRAYWGDVDKHSRCGNPLLTGQKILYVKAISHFILVYSHGENGSSVELQTEGDCELLVGHGGGTGRVEKDSPSVNIGGFPQGGGARRGCDDEGAGYEPIEPWVWGHGWIIFSNEDY